MAIQLVFSKSDDAPWGFRLTGGADCEIPLTVIKVVEGSIAEAAGLQVYDTIIKINKTNVEELSHIEAHDVLQEAGQLFTMTVIRNQDNIIHDDEQHNEEVRNIFEGAVQDFVTEQPSLQSSIEQNGYSPNVLSEGQFPIWNTSHAVFQQNIFGADFKNGSLNEAVALKEIQQPKEQQDIKQKKWSTFLQKPNRPVVSPKKKVQDQPIAEPYRVVITKQPKKNKEEMYPKSESLAVRETDKEINQQNDTLEEVNFIEEEEDGEPNSEVETEVEVEECKKHGEIVEDQEYPEDGEFQEDNYDQENEQETPENEEVELEKNLSLEEQLAQIQQQLQSLAQLPTSIQDTLEAVTKQLAKIVGAPPSQQYVEQQILPYGRQYDEDGRSEDGELASITEEPAEALDSNEECKLDMTDTSDISEDEADDNSQIMYRDVDLKPSEEQLRLKREEEEAEAEAERERQMIELEKLAKQERAEEFYQRRLEQRPTNPLAPVQRPIILPGGRKWSEPEDALPKVRKPKMTDDKICETLDNYSEIITGHTKGINFLKYQPAPKNLDYLQRSEVFRLVHDMDPPKSGIAARSGVIVSEEDYYQKKPFDGGQRTSVRV